MYILAAVLVSQRKKTKKSSINEIAKPYKEFKLLCDFILADMWSNLRTYQKDVHPVCNYSLFSNVTFVLSN